MSTTTQRPLQVLADPFVTVARYLGYSVGGYVVDDKGNTINFLSASISTGYDGYTKFWAYLSGVWKVDVDSNIVKVAFVVNDREAISLVNFILPIKAGYHMFVIKTEITGQTAYTTL